MKSVTQSSKREQTLHRMVETKHKIPLWFFFGGGEQMNGVEVPEPHHKLSQLLLLSSKLRVMSWPLTNTYLQA